MKFLLFLVGTVLCCALTPSATAEVVPIGREEVEEPVDFVTVVGDGGEVLYRKDFDEPIPRGRAIMKVHSDLSKMFELVTRADLQELNSETYRVDIVGIPKTSPPPPSKREDGVTDRAYAMWWKKTMAVLGLYSAGAIGGIVYAGTKVFGS